jgi:hypothetical protein
MKPKARRTLACQGMRHAVRHLSLLPPRQRSAEAKRGKQLVELLLKPVDSALTGLQQAQLEIGPNSKARKLVSALKDLQRLPQIEARDDKQQGFEIGIFLHPRSGSHAPGAPIAFNMAKPNLQVDACPAEREWTNVLGLELKWTYHYVSGDAINFGSMKL